MIALLVIIETIISFHSTRLYTEAKEELLGRDLEAISNDLFLRGYVPELLDYCRKHPDEVGTDVFLDSDFREEYKRVFPGLLERYGADQFGELPPADFPEFSSEEQAVYAHLWYDYQRSYISTFQENYGFSAIALLDVSEGSFGRVFSSGEAETGLNSETLESVVADENGRNGTLSRIAKGEKAEAMFGIAYSGERGNGLNIPVSRL